MSYCSECLHLCSNGFLVCPYPSSPIISQRIKSHYSIKLPSRRHFDHTILLINVYIFWRCFFSEIDQESKKKIIVFEIQQHQYLALQCKYLWRNRMRGLLPFCIITGKNLSWAETSGYHPNQLPVKRTSLEFRSGCCGTCLIESW